MDTLSSFPNRSDEPLFRDGTTIREFMDAPLNPLLSSELTDALDTTTWPLIRSHNNGTLTHEAAAAGQTQLEEILNIVSATYPELPPHTCVLIAKSALKMCAEYRLVA